MRRSTPSPWAILAFVTLCLGLLAPAHAMVTGIVSGKVADAETGALLSGANVVLVGTELTTVTDDAGRYVITNVPPGAYQVAASLVGYAERVTSGVEVLQDQTTVTDIALKPTVVEVPGAEAEVVAERVKPRKDVSATVYRVTSNEEQLTRGQPNDLYQFPGIVFGQPGVIPDNAAYPHIRGARDDQVGYFLEGILITEPNNNVFTTNIVTVGLDRLELYTGGYPAQYGGYVGGIINEVVKRGDQVRGGFVDMSFGSPWDYRDMIVEAGNVADRWNWYFQSNVWRSNFPENNFTNETPNVSDAIFKGIYDLGSRDKLTVLTGHGYARYFFVYPKSMTFDPEAGDFVAARAGMDYGRQSYGVDAVTLNHTLSPKAFWTARFYHSHNNLLLDLGSEVNNFWIARWQDITGAQLDYTNQVSPRHLVKAGVWHLPSNNYQRSAMNLGIPPEFGIGPLDYVADNDTRNSQAYLGDRWNVSDRLTLDLGLRYNRMKYERAEWPTLTLSKVSPRVAGTYLANPRTLLRASWGRYVQMPPAARTGIVFASNFPIQRPFFASVQQERSDLRPEVDTAWDAGVERKLGASTLASLTYFKRKARDMVQLWAGESDDEFDVDAPFHFASNGRGEAQGLELKVDRRLAHNLEGWLSYTYAKARATSPANNAYPFGSPFGYGTGLDKMYYVDWDQRHTAALVLNHKCGRWEFNPWMSYGSGYKYGQSGGDLGGDDYQHGISPTFTDAGSVTHPYGEFTDVPILVNGELQPTQPDALRTGDHYVVSLNISYHATPDQTWYLALHNILRSDTATNLAWYDPATTAVLGYHKPTADYPHGYIEYAPYTVSPPFVGILGFRQKF
jgi:outer membrane receptor protein involved in Fe transport